MKKTPPHALNLYSLALEMLGPLYYTLIIFNANKMLFVPCEYKENYVTEAQS